MKKINYDLSTSTPAPWFILRQDHEHALISSRADRSWSQPLCYIGKVRANNARLIAAAPVLLAACEQVLKRLDLCSDETERAALTEILDQALQQAKG